MMKRKINLSVAVAASLAIISGNSAAQETVNSTATVVVQNAFSLSESQALTFGTITIQGGLNADTTTAGDIQATVTVPANGSTPTSGTIGTVTDGDAGDVNATASILTSGVPATFDIAGAAAFTALTITVPADNAVTLSASSAPTGNGTFSIVNSDLYDVVNGVDITVSANTGTITTDASGAAQFAFGAQLNSLGPSATGVNYIDGTYSGNYAITVAY